MKNKTQRLNQKLINAELRLAIRKGELPYTFVDSQEKTYRQIVYKLGQEMIILHLEDQGSRTEHRLQAGAFVPDILAI